MDASRLLRCLIRSSGPEMCLLVVDSELFYPGIGTVFGCSAGRSAIISKSCMDQTGLAREALHEVGHLMGLEHCQDNCVMNLSKSREEAGKKPSFLCKRCSSRLAESCL